MALLLLLPVCICIFTANLKSISCFAESGYNANIYVYLGQFHSRRMALPAFYWPPELCFADCGAVDISLSPFSPPPLPLPLLLRLENDAKVLLLHATWRMRNIYLCQLSLIAVQCQLRCQFTFIPTPFDISPPLSLQCSLTFHFRPALSSISARYGVRFPLCASANAQPTVAEIDSLSNLSACPSVSLSVRLLAWHLSVCPFVHQSAWCGLPGVSI